MILLIFSLQERYPLYLAWWAVLCYFYNGDLYPKVPNARCNACRVDAHLCRYAFSKLWELLSCLNDLIEP